jgi:hypothetical protein
MVGPHRFLPLLTDSGYCPHSVPGFKPVKALVWTPYPTHKVPLSYGFKHDEKGVQLKIIWIKKNKEKEKTHFLALARHFQICTTLFAHIEINCCDCWCGLECYMRRQQSYDTKPAMKHIHHSSILYPSMLCILFTIK